MCSKIWYSKAYKETIDQSRKFIFDQYKRVFYCHANPYSMSKSFLHWQCIHYHCWIHDMCAKIEFQIQILHNCHSSNADSVYTVSVEKNNPYSILILHYLLYCVHSYALSWSTQQFYHTITNTTILCIKLRW